MLRRNLTIFAFFDFTSAVYSTLTALENRFHYWFGTIRILGCLHSLLDYLFFDKSWQHFVNTKHAPITYVEVEKFFGKYAILECLAVVSLLSLYLKWILLYEHFFSKTLVIEVTCIHRDQNFLIEESGQLWVFWNKPGLQKYSNNLFLDLFFLR